MPRYKCQNSITSGEVGFQLSTKSQCQLYPKPWTDNCIRLLKILVFCFQSLFQTRIGEKLNINISNQIAYECMIKHEKGEEKNNYITNTSLTLLNYSHLLLKDRGQIEFHIFFGLFIKWFLTYI